MRILPGLTTTKKDRVPSFIEDLSRLRISEIALFPTCLAASERAALYAELERLPGLRVPHVHIRSDMDEAELDYLVERFGAQAFNIHPRASSHPFLDLPARFKAMSYVENVEEPPEPGEFAGLGGLCPDFSHWANALAFGRAAYDRRMRELATALPIGCCHLSALRVGVPNAWHGEYDHHEFASLADLDYLASYATFMPDRWASLELENSLPEQLAARDYLERLLGVA
jgi:hypothetical protein